MVNVTLNKQPINVTRNSHYYNIAGNLRTSGMWPDNVSNAYLSEDQISISAGVIANEGLHGYYDVAGTTIVLKMPALYFLAEQRVEINLKQDTANYLSI